MNTLTRATLHKLINLATNGLTLEQSINTQEYQAFCNDLQVLADNGLLSELQDVFCAVFGKDLLRSQA